MAVTPTSMINRLMGLENNTAVVAIAAATTTLTWTVATHAGMLTTIASTGGLTITPPAATGTFNCYTLLAITSISGGSVTIDAKLGNASDVFGGNSFSGASGGTAGTFGTATNSNLITLNATTTGGLIGTLVQMIDMKTNAWYVLINNVCSGTAATPFSNH